MKPRRVLITAGGTGGHIYPAVGLANLLEGHEILFAGGKLSTNRFFANSGFNFAEVPCAPLPLRKPWNIPQSLWTIGSGVRHSVNLLNQFKPDVVVGFGSFYTLPILIASKLKKIPIVLHEQNRPLGKVNKLLAPFVDALCVHFPDTRSNGPAHVVGLPLRSELKKGRLSKKEAAAHYGLDPDTLTILTFGGSQGAKKLNETFAKAIPHLKSKIGKFQVIHLIGEKSTIEKSYFEEQSVPVYIGLFERHMEYAWSLADIAVCRSGAGTVAELIEFEVPGVLIPYPYAAELHQDHNADFVVDKVGLGVKIQEGNLTPEKLAETISLLKNSDQFRRNGRQYKQTLNNKNFVEIVLDSAGVK